MNIIAIFVLGLLIGWIVEWILDWFYWRGRINKVVNENAGLKERIISLEDELTQRPTTPIPAPVIIRSTKDNLQDIHGIGPVFSKRLNEAGIHTFEQLAQLTPKDMEETLGTLFKRFFSGENTILTQAKEFAEQKAQNG
jgi:predicted flap endonuclease-1-like 5' DNA nuclease